MTTSSNPLPINPRSRLSEASASSTSSSPPFSSNYHPNSINHKGQGHARSSTIPTDANSSSSSASDTSSFIGTPFAFAFERPYEYPFPSPATESCPNLSSPSNLVLGHVPAPTQSLLSSPVEKNESLPPSLPSVLPPPVLAPNPPQRRQSSTRLPLLVRRTSHAPDVGMHIPVPPGLVAKAREAREMNRRRSIGGGTAMRGAQGKLSLPGR